MTQKEKEQLLVDLCGRLPYMPKIKITYLQQGIKGTDEGRVSCDFIEKIVNDLRNGVITDMQIYLRPLSSMTDEEREEYRKFSYYGAAGMRDNEFTEMVAVPSFEKMDYLNSHHFDYRGLIEKGLAIAVNENNNP